MGADQAQWTQLVESAAAAVQQARTLDADWPPGTLEAADADLQAALADTPQPVPFVSPLPPGAVYGQTKWLPGSLGCDLFCHVGAPVFAPADCIIEEALGGVGEFGGDELILSRPDKSWAWRYRHTMAQHPVGYQAAQGEQVGVVGDSSLDQLGPIPAWAVQQAGGEWPDPEEPWQHLDLSVNQGTDQFTPTGGGGGNTNAFDWLQYVGYQGTVLERTPGPPDAGWGQAAAQALLGPPAGPRKLAAAPQPAKKKGRKA